LVVTEWLRLKIIHLLYFKIDINFVLGHGSWLGCYNEYGVHFAIFHTYLENPMIWSQLGQESAGGYLFILIEDL
jgi:hypothetical protein